MKKILYFTIAAILAIFAVSCVDQNLDQELGIQISESEIQIGAQGEVKKIVYLVAGAEADAAVTVANDAEWLEVSADLPRLIVLTAEKNETGEERIAEVTVSYPGCEDAVIKVTQASWVDPITLTVSTTEATSVTFSVSKSKRRIWPPRLTE